MHSSLVFLLISLVTPAICVPGGIGDIQLELTHVDYGRQLTKLELLTRAARRSQARAALLSAMHCTSDHLSRANIAFHQSGDLEYVLEVAIGTPPRPLPLLLDTGSDLIWTQCKPCSKCLKQPSPVFDPSKSSTYSLLPCSNKLCKNLKTKSCVRKQCMYNYSYTDTTSTYGGFARETFTIDTGSNIKVPLAFGCGTVNGGDLNNSSGIIGFSRAPISFVSQLGVPGFSYCMADDVNKRTALKFGTKEEIYRDIQAPVQTTNFVDDSSLPGLYFVSMTGISVGTKRLSIPKSAFDKGVVVDSGTAFSLIPDVAFDKLKDALLSKLKLPLSNLSIMGLDCFASSVVPPSQVKVPKITLHFDGIDLELPRENSIADDDELGLLCLAMLKTPLTFGIIGNVQQMNMQVYYDLKNSQLAIAPNQCDKK